MAIVAMTVQAQTANRLAVSAITAQTGKVQLPVSIENTDEIVAVQFDLTLPTGITADPTATLSERCDGHAATVQNISGQVCRVLLYSPANRPLRGQSGNVLYIPVTISSDLAEGSEHQLAISKATLSKANGENVLTAATAGTIRIAKQPDLVPQGITVSPTDLAPGSHLIVAWTVENTGELATNNGWSEQISLISADDQASKLIATTYYEQALAAKSSVSRQAEIVLPLLPGIDGSVRLQVRIVPNSDTGEPTSAQGNNTLTADASLQISKTLTLELGKRIAEEGSDTQIACKLSRSGSWATEQTFSIVTTADSRITVPTSVNIPAGQSAQTFYIAITDDQLMQDADSALISLTASGNGYPEATAQFTLVDDELPSLEVNTSKTIVNEGETFQLTISTNRLSDLPVTVSLTSENSRRFNYPSQVTIPAGQVDVTVDVTAVDDDLPSMNLDNAFTVSAPRHNKAEVIVLLTDDDIPALSLTLTPNQVAESAGVVSVAAVLRRTGKTDNKITVKLSDDADGGIYYSNSTIEMAKGVEEVYFNLGPVDNAQVDGDRTYTITAAVYISSCSCNVSGESAGVVSAQLTVLDDDGPTLSLTSVAGTVKEGSTTTLTISRNTTVDAPLSITLSSDYDDNLQYDHSVTIPAGEQSVTVPVTSLANDQSGDSHTVVFTATAEDFGSGTCWLMVTDQTLPDARVSGITLSESSVTVNTPTIVNVTVENIGAATLNAPVQVILYSEGVNESIATIYTTSDIGIGETETVSTQIKGFDLTGTKVLFAKVNESRQQEELLYTNNTSESITLDVISPLTSTEVQTDKGTYKQGETVLIAGSVVTTQRVQEVEIYIINNGVRQSFSTEIDEQGKFEQTFTPSSAQAGHFIVGVCYPQEGKSDELCAFDIYGFKRTSSNYITCETLVGKEFTEKVETRNAGILPLTNITAEIIKSPANCEVTIDGIDELQGTQSDFITFRFLGTQPTEGTDWDTLKVKLTAAEGCELNLNLYYLCRTEKGNLMASIQAINTTMTLGKVREYPFTIKNTGSGETGNISLVLPSWITSTTPKTLPSLKNGEEATVVLNFTPTEQMQLNVPVTGHLGFNCENANGITIPFSIEPVSESTGILAVDVCDEYTYNTAEAPHVKGAKVTVNHITTGNIVATGETDEDGIFRVEIPEGYYTLNVSADKHSSYTGNILVNPGTTETQKLVNLSYQAVTITWDMEETTVEDVYKIETTIVYETNVPLPVVEAEFPENMPLENHAFNIIATNRGLITAQNITIDFPEITGVTFELLTDNHPTIQPQETVVYTCRVIVDKDALDITNCFVAYFNMYYSWYCGTEEQQGCTSHSYTYGTCTQSEASLKLAVYGSGSGSGPSAPGGGSGSVSAYSSQNYVATTVERNCNGEGYENQNTVCASVSLRFSQTLTMTRQAFRGTLTMTNGNVDGALTDIKLSLKVKSEDGSVATQREFQINHETLTGFSGEMGLDSGWSLETDETGVATIIFIPTKYAAPTEPINYAFGGSISYMDPTTDLLVTMELSPVTLTVKPSPELDLTYFMQRDIYGDDPLTEEVEPMVPAEFALIINNKGYGDATDVRMVTQQPEITQNEKGLLINFELISSQVNGEAANLSFGQTITNNFGTIPAHSQAYAQWWLQSSLLGHFTDYNVEATHITSYGNEDLSLLDEVSIHELIHGFTVKTDGEKPVRGFLVNEIADAEDTPDTLFFTDATQQGVSIAADADITAQSDTEYLLTVKPSKAGWNYGSLLDPTYGKQQLISITRQSDGAIIPVDNIWQTDRTLRDGKDWLYENRLHYVGNMAAEGETYLLTFEPKADVELAVESYEGVPEEGKSLHSPLTGLTVKFNKPIDAATFTVDDLSLTCQGIHLEEVTAIAITPLSETEYQLNLAEATLRDGFYVLTVQTAGITDQEGFNGKAGKTASWIQFADITVTMNITDAHYATFIAPFDVEIPTGVTAYTVSGLEEGSETTLALSEIKQTIPANTPVVLYSESPTRKDFTGQSLAAGADTYTNGILTGVYKATPAPDGTYVLQNHDNIVGFYQVDAQLLTPTVPAYHAYLTRPATDSDAKAYLFPGTVITSIEAVTALNLGEAEGIYNGSGVRLNALQKGINIVKMKNGLTQKILVK